MRHDPFDDDDRGGEADAALSGAATADLLRALAPAPAGADLEAIAFEAGRRAGRRSLAAYRATTALLAVALIGTGLVPRDRPAGGGGAGRSTSSVALTNDAAPPAGAGRARPEDAGAPPAPPRLTDVGPAEPARPGSVGVADGDAASSPAASYASAVRLQERLIDEGLSALPRVRAVPLASPGEAERFERQLRNGGGL